MSITPDKVKAWALTVAASLGVLYGVYQQFSNDAGSRLQAVHLERHFQEAPTEVRYIETSNNRLVFAYYESDGCMSITASGAYGSSSHFHVVGSNNLHDLDHSHDGDG